ncbi:unnamed protein product [Didymodactylos carnosus]|uniref:EF-hand domain-containing protein n=1 Tax=Didymodactylos carnosus TaxID=1234261 RepID=A0A814AJ46_9BILA|nr:unnamed protein product [Didymodactylos carnosus]CAF0916151.1 unnamed protein product [Didymodactylos carnosus]CAF3579789.1 unnamed protein product [Didymodactylos carnosus]CAF3696214.1 unnamed protein product [Didymodactylos carnosus]
MPNQNASPEEWNLFWKLLHNYYAIIARPRFGKRTVKNDAVPLKSISLLPDQLPSPDQLLSIINQYTDTNQSKRNSSHAFNHIDYNGNGRIDLNELYQFLYPELLSTDR